MIKVLTSLILLILVNVKHCTCLEFPSSSLYPEGLSSSARILSDANQTSLYSEEPYRSMHISLMQADVKRAAADARMAEAYAKKAVADAEKAVADAQRAEIDLFNARWSPVTFIICATLGLFGVLNLGRGTSESIDKLSSDMGNAISNVSNLFPKINPFKKNKSSK